MRSYWVLRASSVSSRCLRTLGDGQRLILWGVCGVRIPSVSLTWVSTRLRYLFMDLQLQLRSYSLLTLQGKLLIFECFFWLWVPLTTFLDKNNNLSSNSRLSVPFWRKFFILRQDFISSQLVYDSCTATCSVAASRLSSLSNRLSRMTSQD